MNELKNHYRNCAYCTHNCCYHRSTQSSRGKKNSTLKNSTLNRTILQMKSSNRQEKEALRTENTALRKELLQVSSFLQEPPTETIEEKLFFANRNYQESVLKLAELNKQYDQIKQENNELKVQLFFFKKNYEELITKKEKIHRKSKRSNSLEEKYFKLKFEHEELRKKIELKEKQISIDEQEHKKLCYLKENNCYFANASKNSSELLYKEKFPLECLKSALSFFNLPLNISAHSNEQMVITLISYIVENVTMNSKIFEKEVFRQLIWVQRKYELLAKKFHNLFIFLNNEAFRSKMQCEDMLTEVSRPYY